MSALLCGGASHGELNRYKITNTANTANGAFALPPQICETLLYMDETQFGGPDAQEPFGRKPDGRCLLNRLSPDRQAAVADYAASHTLPETVEWLKNPAWPPEPGDTTQAGPGAVPSPLSPHDPPIHQSTNPPIHQPPGHPQQPAVSRSALARWLPGYRLRHRCAQNRNSVGALIQELRSARPAWTPDEVHQAAQTFFEALAFQRQEPRLWALTQRLDLRRAQLELSATKHKDSQRTKLKLGLDLIVEAFRDNPKALKLYEEACDMIEPECPLKKDLDSIDPP